MKKKIFVGLSGGVDSGVSAALLQKAGHDVEGVFIRIVLPGYPCPAITDRQDAMRVAAHLRIPFREIDLSNAYKEKVFAYTLSEFAKGATPNPDTLCNREIKFGLFYEYAMAQGADAIATGHYARVQTHTKRTHLLKGVDPEKDQSYFLWMVPEEKLSHTFFPIGHLLKSEVRNVARQVGLPNADRKDSQGLCFLGDISMHDMLAKELPHTKGDVLSDIGESIGTHEGASLYTIGQRHGFTIDSKIEEEKSRLYVIQKDIEKNTITVSAESKPKQEGKTKLVLREVNILGEFGGGEALMRYRYRQKLIQGSFMPDNAEAYFDTQEYIPKGQSLVCYVGERCLGGGIVDNSEVL